MVSYIDIHTHKEEIPQNGWQMVNLLPQSSVVDTPFSVGIHPWYVSQNWLEEMPLVKEKSQNPNCFAIGECGLDSLCTTDFELQKKVFEEHINWANEVRKPLIIHCVKAFDDLLKSLEIATVPVIIHDYGKSAEMGKQLQRKGYFLSCGKAVFRRHFQNVLPKLDITKLFLETDDSNYSITEVYKQASEILGCTVEELQLQIQENLKALGR